MRETRRAALAAAGIDVDEALERMMGSEALLERLLGKFPADENYGKLCRALDQGDREAAVAASHALKGVCGNLSMTTLFSCFARQVEVLRQGDLEEAQRLMEQIAPAYEAACRAIGGQDDAAR